jgi:hypothetical protein
MKMKLKNLLYYFVGALLLFMNNSVYASYMPLSSQLEKDAEKQGFFEFFTGFFNSGAALVFFVLGVVTFFVWLVFIISNLWDWKNDRKELGDVLRNGFIVSGIAVFVFVVLVSANAMLT